MNYPLIHLHYCCLTPPSKRKQEKKDPQTTRRTHDKRGGSVLGKNFLFFEKIGCARQKNLQMYF